MPIDDVTDLDWYLDNIVVPSGIERRPVGSVLAWQGSWNALAHQLREASDDSPVGPAVRRALGRGFVLTRAQARECGMSDATLRRLVRRSEWTSCGYGSVAVVPASRPASDDYDAARRLHALQAAAAAGKRDGHVGATASAATLHGLPVFAVPTKPELFGGRGATFGRLNAAHVRRADLGADELDAWFGIDVTSTARTIVDLARLDPRSGLIAADAALHERIVQPSELAAQLTRASGAHGIRRAREVLGLASPLIESPLESLTNLALHDGGFPQPGLQIELRGADGKTYRVDFLWPHLGLVLEADGRRKYRSDQLWNEKRREIALTRAGYRVVRVTWADVVDDWPATSAWLRELITPQQSS
jgi:hypothetical protein